MSALKEGHYIQNKNIMQGTVVTVPYQYNENHIENHLGGCPKSPILRVIPPEYSGGIHSARGGSASGRKLLFLNRFLIPLSGIRMTFCAFFDFLDSPFVFTVVSFRLQSGE